MLMDPAIAGNVERMLEASKEHAELTPIVERTRLRRKLQQELAETEELLADPDMKEMAQEEKASLLKRIEVLDLCETRQVIRLDEAGFVRIGTRGPQGE